MMYCAMTSPPLACRRMGRPEAEDASLVRTPPADERRQLGAVQLSVRRRKAVRFYVNVADGAYETGQMPVHAAMASARLDSTS